MGLEEITIPRTPKIQVERILGDELDLASAYVNEPPARDDVILGLEPGNVGILGGQGGISEALFEERQSRSRLTLAWFVTPSGSFVTPSGKL